MIYQRTPEPEDGMTKPVAFSKQKYLKDHLEIKEKYPIYSATKLNSKKKILVKRSPINSTSIVYCRASNQLLLTSYIIRTTEVV